MAIRLAPAASRTLFALLFALAIGRSYWSFRVEYPVRTAMSIGVEARPVHSADRHGTVYAVAASGGALRVTLEWLIIDSR